MIITEIDETSTDPKERGIPETLSTCSNLLYPDASSVGVFQAATERQLCPRQFNLQPPPQRISSNHSLTMWTGLGGRRFCQPSMQQC
jgi:hypothetical protein